MIMTRYFDIKKKRKILDILESINIFKSIFFIHIFHILFILWYN